MDVIAMFSLSGVLTLVLAPQCCHGLMPPFSPGLIIALDAISGNGGALDCGRLLRSDTALGPLFHSSCFAPVWTCEIGGYAIRHHPGKNPGLWWSSPGVRLPHPAPSVVWRGAAREKLKAARRQ